MARWCRERGVSIGAVLGAEQALELGRRWYADRLARELKPRTVEEMKQVFEATGLEGAFWKVG